MTIGLSQEKKNFGRKKKMNNKGYRNIFDSMDKQVVNIVRFDDVTKQPKFVYVKSIYTDGIFDNQPYSIYTPAKVYENDLLMNVITVEYLNVPQYGIEHSLRCFNRDNYPRMIEASDKDALFSELIGTVKIDGYVARDISGSLWFHYRKPHIENDIEPTWWGSNDKSFEIYDFDFPDYKDVTFEGGPVEVELTLRRK